MFEKDLIQPGLEKFEGELAIINIRQKQERERDEREAIKSV